MSRVVSVWHLAHALHIHEQVEEGLEFRGRVHKHTRFSPWMKDITVHDLILLCLPNKLNQCKCVCFDLFNMAYSKCVGNLINCTATMPTKVGQEQRQSGSTGSSWAKTPWASLQRSCLHPALITLHRSHHMLIRSLKPPSNNNLPKKKHPELAHGSRSSSAVHCQNTDSALTLHKLNLVQVYTYDVRNVIGLIIKRLHN